MKRFLLLTSFLLTLVSCSNEMEFNEHAFQVTKNNEYWKASDFSVSMTEDGFLRVVGTLNDEVITLSLESSEPGIYDLSAGSNSTAWYVDGEGKGYTSEYRGDGEVILDRYDPSEQTFSGTFRFNAYSSDREVTNFINGVFHRVPMKSSTTLEEPSELRASVDNSEFLADDISASKDQGMIAIDGYAADGSFVKILLPEDITAGSFNLNEQSASGTHAIYGFSNGVTSNAQYGTLFITNHNASIGMLQGTFVFTTLLPNSVSVENGSFKVYY